MELATIPDVRVLLAALDEDAFNLLAGQVRRVQHPSMRVAALPTEIELATTLFAVEAHAEAHQATDRVGPLRDDESGHLFVT